MKFTNLDIANFLTVKTASLELENRGLNVIQGVNEDDGSASSNGSGKSSIVDALYWALFGVTARGLKGDAVVNITAKKECRVSVQLANGATKYRVTRHRKHKEHKNALHVHAFAEDGTCTDMSKGTDAETQKVVEQILGCSQEVFLAAVYSGQEIMPDLPKMTDRELKRLVEESAGMTRIEQAYEEARTRRSAVTAKILNLDTRRDSCRVRLARDEATLSLKATEAEQFEEQRAERVAQAKKRESDKAATVASFAVTLRGHKADHDNAQLRLAELATALADHSKIEATARAAEDAAVRAEGAVSKKLLADARATVATIAGQIENADAEMAKPCPECGKPHTEDEKAEYIAHRTKRLVDAQANLKLVEERVRKEIEEVKRLRDAAVAARAAVPDVSKLTFERAGLMTVVNAFTTTVANARLAKSEHDAAKSELAMRESEPNPAAAVVASLRESIATEAASLAALTTEYDQLQKELEVAEAVVKVFGPAGVRAHILDTVTPFLNDRTADYLSALSDGAIQATWSTLSRSAGGELKEKFAIEVSNSKGGDSFLALSGGEKRKVRLATALALQDLVASRATQPIDLYVGDEVDDALDPAGLERLMVVMERRARERGTVILISHNSLTDWCDSVTTVRKSGGVSTVEGALCA